MRVWVDGDVDVDNKAEVLNLLLEPKPHRSCDMSLNSLLLEIGA
jgi:hypothetical protein